MKILTVVDDKNGMMFHQRRQSQDRNLRKEVLAVCKGQKLWMNEYSAKQFSTEAEMVRITVVENFLELAAEGEYCFVEDQTLAPYQKKIEEVILFHWNRSYPADRYLDLDLTKDCWKRIEQWEIEGFSHDRITIERYRYETD